MFTEEIVGSCLLCLLSFSACEIDDFTEIASAMKYLVIKIPWGHETIQWKTEISKSTSPHIPSLVDAFAIFL